MAKKHGNRWEEEFNKLKALSEQKLDAKINLYKYYIANPTKVPTETLKKEGITNVGKATKDLLTLESFKKNKDKIARYIKFRDDLHIQIAKMSRGPLAAVLKQDQLNKEYKKLEADIKQKYADLKTETDPAKKAKINAEITKLTQQKQANVKENRECELKLQEIKRVGIDGQPFTPERMMQSLRNMQAATVKCDMLCALLMQGKGINDLKFDKSKVTYRAPQKIEEMLRGADRQTRTTPEAPEQTTPERPTQNAPEGPTQNAPEGPTPANLVPQRPRFDFRHPIRSIRKMIETRRQARQSGAQNRGTSDLSEREGDNVSDKDLEKASKIFLENDKFVEEVGNNDSFKDTLKVSGIPSLAQMYQNKADKETDPAKKAQWEAKRDYYNDLSKNPNGGLKEAINKQNETQRRIAEGNQPNQNDGSR